jgi:hypothetical protein
VPDRSTAVYVDVVSRSDAATATLRRIYLGLLFVVVVAASSVAAEASGWTIEEVPAAFFLAPASGCLVLAIVLYVRSRRSRGTGLRLDRIDSATTSHESNDSRREIDGSDAEVRSDITEEPGATDDIDVGELPAAKGSTRNSGDPRGDAGYNIDAPVRDGQSARHAASQSMSTAMPRVQPGRSSSSIQVTIDDANVGGVGHDAMRLAGLLNQFGDVDCGFGDWAAPSGLDPHRDDRVHWERDLWLQLVEDYGAESVDLADAAGGRCRITLASGNMVFYVSGYQRWMWLIFDHAGTRPPSTA